MLSLHPASPRSSRARSPHGSNRAARAAAPAAEDKSIRWDKGVCRYCGVGCGVLIGVKDGRVVATQGDPDAPVNKGLNCIKGYFLAKIQYGRDRLTRQHEVEILP